MSAPLFSDLGKKSKDLLKKGYYTENPVEVELTSKTANNVKIHGVATSARKDGALTALVEPSFQHKAQNYEIGASVSSDPSKGHTFKGTWEPNNVRGLKTSASFSSSSKKTDGKTQDKILTKLGVEYRNLNYTGAVLLNFPLVAGRIRERQPTLNTALTYRYRHMTFGAEAEDRLPLETEGFQISKWALLADYTREDSSITAALNQETISEEEEKFVASLNFYQHVNPNLEIGSEVSVESLLGPARVQFGGVWALDAGSTLRAKINSEGQVGLSFQHKLNSSVTLTASADINAVTQLGHKFGLQFNFSL